MSASSSSSGAAAGGYGIGPTFHSGDNNNDRSTAIVLGNAAGRDGNGDMNINVNNRAYAEADAAAAAAIDPYLADDFHPLLMASREVLNALRADESACDADLYRRLISSSSSSSSSSIPHRYHVAGGEEGRGCVVPPPSSSTRASSAFGDGGIGGGGGRSSPQSHDVVGSPLAAARGRMNARPSPSVPNDGRPGGEGGDTPPPSSSSGAIPPTSHLRYERSVPLPDHLAEASRRAKLSTLMGLLPDAELVWLSADDRLYLWSYGRGREDYCAYAVPGGQCITTVGIVRPRDGVFRDCVSWLLVVATPEEVMLCALARERLDDDNGDDVVDDGGGGVNYHDDNGDGAAPRDDAVVVVAGRRESGGGRGFRHGSNSVLRLVPTRYVIPTDSVPITSIAGTSNGRIFLGGHDGNLYEMTYEGNALSSSGWSGRDDDVGIDVAIDDYFDGSGTLRLPNDGATPRSRRGNDNGGSGALLLSGGKRLFSALTFGSLDERRPLSRSRKCRKINHTSAANSLVTSVVPGAIINAASSMFGSSIDVAARDAGPIVCVVIDEERLCLYTLGAGGAICSYDICPIPADRNADGGVGGLGSYDDVAVATAPPRLASVFDSVASAKLYLEAVSCGRMYPPTTTHNVALGTITFPGGTSSAQAGVGGMEGARDILKRHEQEERVAMAGAIGRGGARNRPIGNTAGILHPVSIHLVPAAESKSLTLVAITGGGLRYYLSSLTLSTINSAQALRGTNVSIADSVLARTRPGRKMTFCHIRAPPPYTSFDGNDGFRFELAPSAASFNTGGVSDGGLPPGIHGVTAGRIGSGGGSHGGIAGGDVVKCSYSSGVFVLALNIERNKLSKNTPSPGGNYFSNSSEERTSSSPDVILGDVIVVAMPDFAARAPNQSNSTFSVVGGTNIAIGSSTSQSALINPPIAPGGISETILLPMGGSTILPGGRTFDIVTHTGGEKSTVMTLFVNSETPTDSELQVGLMPSFIPEKKLYRKTVSTSSSALAVSSEQGRGIISSALSVLSNYLRSGQEFGNQVGSVSKGALGPFITYRVSIRHGCGLAGFSTSAGEMLSASQKTMRQRSSGLSQASDATSAKSARLPAWLLRPTAAPLNYQASQHLLLHTSDSTGSSGQDVLVLNAGGLHFFSNSSLVTNLGTILLHASNVVKDAMVKNVFLSYGNAEGCAMCFALATSSSISAVLRNKAVEAALCYANRPLMKLTGPSAGEGMDPISSYTFQPSSLYEGLVRIVSRLLRPFWYKPAVVVTEGGPIHSKSAYANYYSSLPAKVELLLDDSTLGQIRRPLTLLQNLMKNTFVPAVQMIPGISNKDRAGADAMEVDEVGYSSGDGGLITRSMQHRSRASATAQTMNNLLQAQFATVKELQACAFRTEDRNMHSLYRLLSRCVQMLNLISCLKHAQEIPTLPEVQWGLLHGLTFYQLVSTHEGQERIEALLNALVSQGEKTFVSGFSTDGDILAETLSHQCYLFFSSATRHTYLGFRYANDALSRPFTSPQRIILSNQAASYLRAASRHWYAPALVVGRLSSKISGKGWEDVATNAKEAGSPLALAADILMELRNVEGLADVCLICASNFGGSKVPRDERKECCEDVVQDMLGWERGLYHRPSTSKNGADSRSAGARAILAGIDVTASDALNTCHGIIFHHISVLLKDGNESNQRLAEDLVATCAASPDVKFLHLLYEHLLATNEQIVLRIDSSSLEDWLLKEKKDINLLWNYYSFHGHHILAGDIMWKKAVDTEGKFSLDQRIECLTRAANSFSSSLDSNHSAFNMRGLVVGGFSRGGTSQTLEEQRITVETLRLRNDQIQEQLDVATIQKRILTTISQSQNADLEPAKIDALKFTLVNISDLYNDYACPLNLFDVCLLIFETCRRNDADTINMLWKSIICEEILPCQTNSDSVVDFLTRLKEGSLLEEEAIVYSDGTANDLQMFETGEWIPRLRNRVTTLGKELFGKGADYTFPIDLVVRELEGLRQTFDGTREENYVSKPWPAHTVLDVGVPFSMLIESYSLQMEENAATIGVDITTRLNWLASISEILELWVGAALTSYDNTPIIGSNDIGYSRSASNELIRAINTGLLKRIDICKSGLENLVGCNASSVALIDERFSKVEEIIKDEFC